MSVVDAAVGFPTTLGILFCSKLIYEHYYQNQSENLEKKCMLRK
jgi:hypothetical protein